MAKRKSDFHELLYINPFDETHSKTMVCDEWKNYQSFSQWRKDNSKWLKDPKNIELLDSDELLSQWNIYPTDRKINPSTCNMIFKELAILLRLVDAEHQDAILRDGNNVPGVVYSTSSGKWLYMKYDVEVKDPKKGTKIEAYDSEEEAYYYYKQNRDSLIEQEAAKALEYGLIEESVYDKYFSYSDTISVRDYEYYKEERYKK